MASVEQTLTERLLSRSESDKKLKTICFELFKLKQQEQEVKEKYGELQGRLKQYFKKSGDKSLQFSVAGRNYRVTNVEPKTIVWNVEKLRKRLKENNVDSSVVKQVFENKYSINDWEGFTSVLKKHGMKPQDVIPFLDIQRKVNQKRINELSEVGEITEKDIEGCYELTDGSGYVKLSDWETENEAK